MRLQLRGLGLFLLVFRLTLVPPLAQAQAVPFGPHDVRSVFHVAKSENQNQVHYGLRLDAACRPVGKRPVFAYWRRLRGDTRVDAPLEGLGTTVYGASQDQKVTSTSSGGTVEMYVRALKKVRVLIEVKKGSKGCSAVAYTTIEGQPAKLSHAYLQLGGWGLSVKYVDAVGYRLSDGKRVAERHHR